MAELGRLGAQELAPRGRVEIQIIDLDAGAARMRRGLCGALRAPFGGEAPRVRRLRAARPCGSF